MVTSSEHTDKAYQIIDAAQKRFGLYGLEKTTMREIAADLNLTKGSLYYYFPDKEHLYLAVIEKEQSQFLKHLEDSVMLSSTPDEILMAYVEARIRYFTSLLNLSRMRADAYYNLKPMFHKVMIRFWEQEVNLISRVLKKGVDSGVYFLEDTGSVSLLFLEVLRGFRYKLISRKEFMYIEEDEYESLVEQARSFTEFFIRGLKYRDENN
jgi:AcrR family transcriptional regulator